MSHGTCETVQIEGADGGPIVINKTDFDADKHTLYGEKPKAKRRTAAPKAK